jgi:hypothetical protein
VITGSLAGIGGREAESASVGAGELGSGELGSGELGEPGAVGAVGAVDAVDAVDAAPGSSLSGDELGGVAPLAMGEVVGDGRAGGAPSGLSAGAPRRGGRNDPVSSDGVDRESGVGSVPAADDGAEIAVDTVARAAPATVANVRLLLSSRVRARRFIARRSLLSEKVRKGRRPRRRW